jgi:probable HAF family extracellular repeat protein
MVLPAAAAIPGYFSVSPVSGKYAYAVALNDAGHYAVNSAPPEIPYQAASIAGGGGSENIGSLGGYITRISSLNTGREAVGESTTAAGDAHAFLYASGHMHDLTARYGIATASAINDAGEIAGQTRDYRALVLRKGEVDVFGPPNSAAGDINGRGEVLVEYAPEGRGLRTAVYSGGRLADLPRLGGAHVFGNAINDGGWVTGQATSADGRQHAYLYDGKSITDLTPEAANGVGYDVNDLGLVVGAMDGRAFLYADGNLIDLNTLVDPGADLLLTSAIEINNRAQILAHACDRSGVFCYSTVLLDPVPAIPEPADWMMWLTGVGLLCVRYGKKSQRGKRSYKNCRVVFSTFLSDIKRFEQRQRENGCFA